MFTKYAGYLRGVFVAITILTFCSTFAYSAAEDCSLRSKCTANELVNQLAKYDDYRADERLESGTFVSFPGWKDLPLITGTYRGVDRIPDIVSLEIRDKILEENYKSVILRDFQIQVKDVLRTDSGKVMVPYATDLFVEKSVWNFGAYTVLGLIEGDSGTSDYKVTVTRYRRNTNLKDSARNKTIVNFNKSSVDLNFVQKLVSPVIEAFLAGKMVLVEDGGVKHADTLTQLASLYGPSKPNWDGSGPTVTPPPVTPPKPPAPPGPVPKLEQTPPPVEPTPSEASPPPSLPPVTDVSD